MSWKFPLVATAVAWIASSSLAVATPFQMSYSARLTDGQGRPVQGPIDVDVKFYDSETSTNPTVISIPAKLHFGSLMPSDGVIRLNLDLSDGDFHALFDGQAETWIEITDSTNGKTYPRQIYGAVPYALKVPVDPATLEYDASTGALKVKAIPAAVPVAQATNFTAQLAGDVTGPQGSTAIDKIKSKKVEITIDGASDGKVIKYLAAADGGNGGFTLEPDNNTGTLGTGDVTSNVIADNAIMNVDVNANAAIDPSKIAGGTNVDAAEFGFLDTVSSNIQTQLNTQAAAIGTKADSSHTHDLSGASVTNVLPVDKGGTGTNLALASGGFLKQTVAGGNVTVGAITGADLPASVRSSLDASDGNPAQAVQVDAAGNVGIGTTAPSAMVELSRSGGGPVLRLTNADATSKAMALRFFAGSTPAHQWGLVMDPAASGADRLGFVNNGFTETFSLLQSGNVGVGTTNPGAKLEVNSGALRIKNAAGGYVDLTPEAGAGTAGYTFPTSGQVNGYVLKTNGAGTLSWGADSTGDSFNGIASGTNTSAAMVVGSGASLAATGTGSIEATKFLGSGTTTDAVDLATAEVAGQLTTAKGGTGVNSTATFPTSGVVVTEAGTQTLTNKTLTSPTITGGTVEASKFKGTGTTTDAVDLATAEVAGQLATANGGTGVNSTATFPTSGVVVTEAGTQTLTNKTLTSPTITGGSVEATVFKGSGSTTNAVDLATAEVAGTLTLANGGTGANLSATGGTGQFLKQSSMGGAVTVGAISASDLPNAVRSSLDASDGSPTQAVQVDGAGNVGIGTTSPGMVAGANRYLTVAGTPGTAQIAAFELMGTEAAGTRISFVSNYNGGSTTKEVARIEQGSDGTSSDTGRLIFQTMANAGTLTEKMRIDEAGKVGIGTTNPTDSQLHVQSDSSTRLSIESDGDVAKPVLRFQRARGSTASRTQVTNLSSLGEILGKGWDGAKFVGAAAIDMAVDGTAGLDDVPGKITFSTTPDGSATLVERVLIDNAGNVGVGSANPVAKLDVAGDVRIGNSAATCNATVEGSQRYNSTAKKMEFCNGTNWAAVEGDKFLLDTQTASNSAAITFTNIDGTYTSYEILIVDAVPSVDATPLFMRFSTDNGSTWKSGASDYQWANIYTDYNVGPQRNSDSADSEIPITDESANQRAGNAAGEGFHATLVLYKPASTSVKKIIRYRTDYINEAGQPAFVDGQGFYQSTTAINGVRFFFSTGNITSGTFKLYGIR